MWQDPNMTKHDQAWQNQEQECPLGFSNIAWKIYTGYQGVWPRTPQIEGPHPVLDLTCSESLSGWPTNSQWATQWLPPSHARNFLTCLSFANVKNSLHFSLLLSGRGEQEGEGRGKGLKAKKKKKNNKKEEVTGAQWTLKCERLIQKPLTNQHHEVRSGGISYYAHGASSTSTSCRASLPEPRWPSEVFTLASPMFGNRPFLCHSLHKSPAASELPQACFQDTGLCFLETGIWV